MFPFEVERSAFFGGFGDPAALLGALREAKLVVPLDTTGSVFAQVWGELPWLVAFTSVQRCVTFAEAAGRDTASVEICRLYGAALLDFLDRAPEPTGLVVDAVHSDAMVFPPVQAITPHCYIDEATGKAVRTWAA